MRPPIDESVARLGADTAHRFQPALGRREDVAWVTAKLLQQAVERDGPDVGQVVQDHEGLPLGQGIWHFRK